MQTGYNDNLNTYMPIVISNLLISRYVLRYSLKMFKEMQDSKREIQYHQGENPISSLPLLFPIHIKETRKIHRKIKIIFGSRKDEC